MLVLLLARGADIQSCHHFPRRHRPGALTIVVNILQGDGVRPR